MKIKRILASVGMGALTVAILFALSLVTADNFFAEGPDTAVSQALFAPFGCASLGA